MRCYTREKMTERTRILVADDSDLVLAVAESLLSQSGYEVLRASDGLAALRAIREHRPSLVVLDLLMPKMTGFDVLREMRREEAIAGIPVVVMSGVYKENVVGFLRQIGVSGFLDKENLEATLVARVREILAVSG